MSTSDAMVPRLEWHRGPISGRWILCVDGSLLPRAELFVLPDDELGIVLFTAEHPAGRLVGSFRLVVEAQAAAERALERLTGEGEPAQAG